MDQGPRQKLYEYSGLNSEENPISGVITAASAANAKKSLRIQGIRNVTLSAHKLAAGPTPLDEAQAAVLEAQKNIPLERLAPTLFRGKKWIRLRDFDRLAAVFLGLWRGSSVWKAEEKIAWTRQFAAMFAAGITIPRILEVLSRDETNQRLNGLVKDIAEKISGAVRAQTSDPEDCEQKVADSFLLHFQEARLFTRQETAILVAAEKSGDLALRFNDLAEKMEKSLNFRRLIQASLLQPKIVLVVLWLSFPVLGYGTGHTILSISDATGQSSAPGLWLGAILCNPVWVLFAWLAPLVFTLGLGVSLSHPQTAPFMHRLLLRSPYLGPIYYHLQVALGLRTLGHLVDSGMPITDALSMTAEVALAETMLRARDRIVEGKGLSESFAGELPKPIVMFMTIAEESGCFGKTLLYAASFSEENCEMKLQLAVMLLEPLLLMSVGLVIGGVCILTLSPLVGLLQAL